LISNPTPASEKKESKQKGKQMKKDFFFRKEIHFDRQSRIVRGWRDCIAASSNNSGGTSQHEQEIVMVKLPASAKREGQQVKVAICGVKLSF
jgi:hypothetical protein